MVEEIDVVAHGFMGIKIERNEPEVRIYFASKGREALKEDISYLLARHSWPNGIEKLNGLYELQRYDNLYNEGNGEVYYRYRAPDDKDVLINSWIVVKQNDEDAWKVDSFYGQRQDGITDGSAEKGTVLHELPAEDKE